MPTRRHILSTAAAVGSGTTLLSRAAAAAPPSTIPESPDVDIDIYIDPDGAGLSAQDANEICHRLDAVFETAFPDGVTVSLGPEGVCRIADGGYEDGKLAVELFSQAADRPTDTVDRADAAILLLSGQDTDWGVHLGWGRDRDNTAVATYADFGATDTIVQAAAHEIGHALGLMHKHAHPDGSIMSPRIPDGALAWSRESRRYLERTYQR